MTKLSHFSATVALMVARLDLTNRQAEVLHWVAEGKSNSEIALILECSFYTVKAHMKQIFNRLGVHSRTAAAACAYRAQIEEVQKLRSFSISGMKQRACN